MIGSIETAAAELARNACLPSDRAEDPLIAALWGRRVPPGIRATSCVPPPTLIVTNSDLWLGRKDAVALAVRVFKKASTPAWRTFCSLYFAVSALP